MDLLDALCIVAHVMTNPGDRQYPYFTQQELEVYDAARAFIAQRAKELIHIRLTNQPRTGNQLV